MAHRYLPHTAEDVENMLAKCGLASLEELYSDVPESLRFKGEYNIASEKSESEVRKYFKKKLEKNLPIEINLIGGGYYSHDIPSVIPSIISRSEFLTA